jgi:hypothetical protein
MKSSQKLASRLELLYFALTNKYTMSNDIILKKDDHFTFRINGKVKRAFQRICKKQGVSMAEKIETMMLREMKANGEQIEVRHRIPA